MSEAATELIVEVKRVISAPIEKVFKAWIDPEQMKQWYSPEGMTTPDASSDARKDGKYTVTMAMGGQTFNQGGKYLEVDEPNKLVFTWNSDDSVVTINFKKTEDNKTEITLTHVGFANEETRKMHDDGWVGTINKLEKYF